MNLLISSCRSTSRSLVAPSRLKLCAAPCPCPRGLRFYSHTTGTATTHSHGTTPSDAISSNTNTPSKPIGLKPINFPSPPTFTDKHEEREYLKGRLAIAFRIFGKYGFEEGVAGHITVRDPVEPNTFWVNPLGVSFRLMKRSDLIRVNNEGGVIDGGKVRLLNTAAFAIHHAIHTARSDVNAAAHSHSLYGRAFCALGRNLDIITQDACAFYNDLALYSSFNGIVFAAEEGRAIASSLGDKKAALLQNHGLLTTGRTVEETVFWFMSLDRCCHAQLLADAAAAGRGHSPPIKISDEDAAYTYKTVGRSQVGWFSAKPEFDVVLRECGEEVLD